jgi:hypothetical protein
LLAKADLLHPPSSQLLKEFGLFLEDIDFLLLNLLDVASQGVAGVAESYPLRSGERHVAMRRPLANALRALLGLRTNDAFRPLVTVLHFGVSTFGAGCHFGAVFRDFGSKVFTAERLGRGHRDTEV